MKLKIIKTTKDYDASPEWVDEMFYKKVKPNSEEDGSLQIMLLLFKIGKPTRMEIVTLEEAHTPMANCSTYFRARIDSLL
jgi:hypothetical protein